MCQSSKKEFFKKFLYEPLPVEVSCIHSLVYSTEIQIKQWLLQFITVNFILKELLNKIFVIFFYIAV